MKFHQVPCSSGILTHTPATGALGAIFQRNVIWQPGDRGTITITFGNYSKYSSGCASWSQLGTNSNNSRPSMNLGFIDPPFGQ
jgi:hypothetical protein